MADLLKVRYGIETQLPETRDEFTLYFTTDTKKIFKGDTEYTSEIYNIDVGSESQEQGQRTITLKFKDGSPDATINILNAQAQTAILGILRGTATDTDKGLVTLSDAINDTTNDTSKGVAATPVAVASALEAANNYTDEQIAAGFSANDAMVFKGTIGSNGVIASSDETINGKNISSITTYSTGWTFRVSVAINGLELPSMPIGTTVNVEAGDMIVAINDSGTSLANGNWSIVQANIHGAITLGADSLTQNALVLGAGTSTVKPLANGTAGQVLAMGNTTPTWKGVSTTVEDSENLITADAVYDALLWKSFPQ